MIEVAIWLTLFTVGSTVATVHKHREAWRLMAIELDLHYSAALPMASRLHGVRQGFEVAVFKRFEKNRFRVVIEVRPVDPGFTLRPDSAVARLMHRDVEIGEPGFDEQVRIVGDSALALAVLRAETRKTVELVVVHGDGAVEDGMIRSTARSLDQAPSTLDVMLDLARELRRPDPEQVPALLAQIALQGSAPTVRLRAFQELAASYGETQTLLATARLLRGCSELPLRSEALHVLLGEPGDEGMAAAEDLIRLVQEKQIVASSRRSALMAIADSAHAGLATPILVEILRDTSSYASVRYAALECLVRGRNLEELLALPPRSDSAEATRLARGLSRLGDVAAQPRLLELLGHSDYRVQKAAAEALGAVGDLDAVQPLREVADSTGVLSLGLVPAAESAIAQIQRRAGGSQEGEISLVGVSQLEGAVSPADDTEGAEGGEVSLFDVMTESTTR